MTNLTGTEKQVSWANDIRSKFAEGFDALMAKAEKAGILNNPVEAEAFAQFQAAKETAMAKTEAKWWIDNGRNGIPFICQEILAGRI